MRLVLRDNLTNEIIVELFDMIEEGLTEQDILELILKAPGMDSETLELLQNENYHLSYEEVE